MKNDTGSTRTAVRYRPAGNAVALAPVPLGVIVVGMDLDEASVMLRVLVQSPDEPYMVARRIVTLPLGRGADGDLTVGTPRVQEEEDDDEVV